MQLVGNEIIYDGANTDPAKAFAGTPSLAALSGGALLCAFKTGPAKLSAADNITIVKSIDNGSTWHSLSSGFDTTFAGIPGSIHACHIAEVEQGTLLAACCWIDRADPDAPYANPKTGGLRPIKCLLTRSNDSGLSWSPFREISFKYHKAAVVTGPMLKLKSGNLFLAYENFKQWDEADGNYSSAGVLSEDNGASWSWPITFASDPFARQYYWDNKLTVNPATGDLLAALWTVTNTYENKSIHLVRATPDATQWTSPSPIGIVGKSAAPLYLDAKTVLLVYVDPSGDGAIKAVLSSDAGRTWHTDDACAIYQAPARAAAQKDFYSAAFGGPDLVRCGDDILVLYYAGSENQLSICSARIKI